MVALDWNHIVETIQKHHPAVRIKWNGDPGTPQWCSGVIIPTGGYIETGPMGPVPFRDVEWIEVDAAQSSQNGRLVPCNDPLAIMNQIKMDCDIFVFHGTVGRIDVRLSD